MTATFLVLPSSGALWCYADVASSACPFSLGRFCLATNRNSKGSIWFSDTSCSSAVSILHGTALRIFRHAAACCSLRIQNMPYNKRDKSRSSILLVFAALSHVGSCLGTSPPARRWPLDSIDFIRVAFPFLPSFLPPSLPSRLLLLLPLRHCRISTASCGCQWALPDLITSSRCQRALPGFNRKLQVSVGSAGRRLRGPDLNRESGSARVSENARIECQKECQSICQKECQIECQCIYILQIYCA